MSPPLTLFYARRPFQKDSSSIHQETSYAYPHQSPQAPSSSFFEAADEDFIALVPTFLGLLACCCVFASPAAAKSSQKSFFSFGGPAGSAPKESQKSFSQALLRRLLCLKSCCR